MNIADLEHLERLVALATPQKLETAEMHATNEWLDCPFCDGEGSVDGATFTNYDDAAIGVQFFGVGDQFVHNETAYRAVWAALPELLKLARTALANGFDRGRSMTNAIAQKRAAIIEASKAESVAALIGERFYDNSPPENVEFPYVSLGRTEEIRDALATTLHVWSRTGGRSEALDVLAALRNVMPFHAQFTDVFRSGDGRTTHGVLRLIHPKQVSGE